MTKAIVVFDSKFGNTERVARSLATGLQDGGVETACLRFDQVTADGLRDFDLVAIGGPTQNRKISQPLEGWLQGPAASGLGGKRGFAFDTRIKSRFAGSAAKGIQAIMESRGMKVAMPYAEAVVLGTKGPLEAGAEETFRQLGTQIAKLPA